MDLGHDTTVMWPLQHLTQLFYSLHNEYVDIHVDYYRISSSPWSLGSSLYIIYNTIHPLIVWITWSQGVCKSFFLNMVLYPTDKVC